jgi:hypothetical protein
MENCHNWTPIRVCGAAAPRIVPGFNVCACDASPEP